MRPSFHPTELWACWTTIQVWLKLIWHAERKLNRDHTCCNKLNDYSKLMEAFSHDFENNSTP